VLIYQTRIFKGLFYPNRSFYQLEKAEKLYGLRLRVLWLLLASAFIFALSGWFGIGTHVISPELVKIKDTEYEGLKSYFILGRFILGLLYAAILLSLTSLWFWTMTDTWYTKLLVLQAFTLPIVLLEHITYLLLATGVDLPWYSSPLSLGVIAQYITSNEFVIYLLGSISVFKIWVIALQYNGLRVLTEKSRLGIWIMIIPINILYWSVAALLAYLDFKKIL